MNNTTNSLRTTNSKTSNSVIKTSHKSESVVNIDVYVRVRPNLNPESKSTEYTIENHNENIIWPYKQKDELRNDTFTFSQVFTRLFSSNFGSLFDV